MYAQIFEIFFPEVFFSLNLLQEFQEFSNIAFSRQCWILVQFHRSTRTFLKYIACWIVSNRLTSKVLDRSLFDISESAAGLKHRRTKVKLLGWTRSSRYRVISDG